MLEALGNAGDPGTEAFLVVASRDSNDRIRAAAASGLRRVATPGTTASLARMLERDESPAVRARAADALGANHAPESTGALSRALLEDGDEEVRSLAMDALARRSNDPRAQEALSLAAGRDSSRTLRECARAILSREG